MPSIHKFYQSIKHHVSRKQAVQGTYLSTFATAAQTRFIVSCIQHKIYRQLSKITCLNVYKSSLNFIHQKTKSKSNAFRVSCLKFEKNSLVLALKIFIPFLDSSNLVDLSLPGNAFTQVQLFRQIGFKRIIW